MMPRAQKLWVLKTMHKQFSLKGPHKNQTFYGGSVWSRFPLKISQKSIFLDFYSNTSGGSGTLPPRECDRKPHTPRGEAGIVRARL